MQGHYRRAGEARPRSRRQQPGRCCSDIGTGASGRLFLCATPLCRTQTIVCSRCDRGQIYCAQGCAGEARRRKQREAGQRYQSSFRGRRNHAARQARYRARRAGDAEGRRLAQRNKVTHQGSPEPPQSELLSSDLATAEDGESSASEPVVGDSLSTTRCHWCACRCPDRVRHEFLRRRRVHSIVETDRIGLGNDDTS